MQSISINVWILLNACITCLCHVARKSVHFSDDQNMNEGKGVNMTEVF